MREAHFRFGASALERRAMLKRLLKYSAGPRLSRRCSLPGTDVPGHPRSPEPLAATSFFIAVDAVIPPDIQVHPLPVEVEQLAPQLRGFGYVVIEEQIAIVDQATRKIDLTFPRWR